MIYIIRPIIWKSKKGRHSTKAPTVLSWVELWVHSNIWALCDVLPICKLHLQNGTIVSNLIYKNMVNHVNMKSTKESPNCTRYLSVPNHCANVFYACANSFNLLSRNSTHFIPSKCELFPAKIYILTMKVLFNMELRKRAQQVCETDGYDMIQEMPSLQRWTSRDSRNLFPLFLAAGLYRLQQGISPPIVSYCLEVKPLSWWERHCTVGPATRSHSTSASNYRWLGLGRDHLQCGDYGASLHHAGRTPTFNLIRSH